MVSGEGRTWKGGPFHVGKRTKVNIGQTISDEDRNTVSIWCDDVRYLPRLLEGSFRNGASPCLHLNSRKDRLAFRHTGVLMEDAQGITAVSANNGAEGANLDCTHRVIINATQVDRPFRPGNSAHFATTDPPIGATINQADGVMTEGAGRESRAWVDGVGDVSGVDGVARSCGRQNPNG